MKDLFAECLAAKFRQVPHGYHRTVNKGPGRIEIRACWTRFAPDYLDDLRQRYHWSGLQTVRLVRVARRMNGKRTTALRYYISSLANAARRLLAGVRKHWGLDIAFREDESRMRTRNSPENFAMVRHVAHVLLKQEKTEKVGINAKRMKAAWDRDYLLPVLSV